jgi:hypothetical protein
VDAFVDTSIGGGTVMSDDVGTYLTPPSYTETIGTLSSWVASGSYDYGDSTYTESGNDTDGFNGTLVGGTETGGGSGYGSPPSSNFTIAGNYQLDAFQSSQVVPTNAIDGSLLSTLLVDADYSVPLDIAIVAPTQDRLLPDIPTETGDYAVTLTDGRTDLTYAPPLTVIAYRGGMLLTGGSSGAGFNATGNLAAGTAAADTDAAPLLLITLTSRKMLAMADDSCDLFLSQPVTFDHRRIVRREEARGFPQGCQHRRRDRQIGDSLPRRLDSHEAKGAPRRDDEVGFKGHIHSSFKEGWTSVIVPLNFR